GLEPDPVAAVLGCVGHPGYCLSGLPAAAAGAADQHLAAAQGCAVDPAGPVAVLRAAAGAELSAQPYRGYRYPGAADPVPAGDPAGPGADGVQPLERTGVF